MDPYTPAAIGLVDDGAKIQADTVISSSLTDVAHGNVGLIAGEPRVINALDVARDPGATLVDGEPLVTVEAAEAPDHLRRRRRQRPLRVPGGRAVVPAHGRLGYGLDAESSSRPSPAAATSSSR